MQGVSYLGVERTVEVKCFDAHAPSFIDYICSLSKSGKLTKIIWCTLRLSQFFSNLSVDPLISSSSGFLIVHGCLSLELFKGSRLNKPLKKVSDCQVIRESFIIHAYNLVAIAIGKPTNVNHISSFYITLCFHLQKIRTQITVNNFTITTINWNGMTSTILNVI